MAYQGRLLNPNIAGAWYDRHEVAFAAGSGPTRRAHVVIIDLAINAGLRVHVYYDHTARRIVGSGTTSPSWWNQYGNAANALALVSGTFFNPAAPNTPFGDVNGPQLDFQLTAEPAAGGTALLRNVHRCYLAYRASVGRYEIGFRHPQDTLASIQTRFDQYLSGGGWLVYAGQDAVAAASAAHTATVTVANRLLYGQTFQADVFRPGTVSLPNWHMAAAVDATGRRVALIVTENLWPKDAISQWLRGQVI